MMRNLEIGTLCLFFFLVLFLLAVKDPKTAAAQKGTIQPQTSDMDDAILREAREQITKGRQTFRYDTFGDQDF